MCSLTEVYFICNKCRAITRQPVRRTHCCRSMRSGRLNAFCPKFNHWVDVVVIAPTCTDTPCYWCSVGRPPPREDLLFGRAILHWYISQTYIAYVLGYGRSKRSDASPVLQPDVHGYIMEGLRILRTPAYHFEHGLVEWRGWKRMDTRMSDFAGFLYHDLFEFDECFCTGISLSV